MKTLEQLEPGDTVVMSHGWYNCALRTIDRVTATQIVIGRSRYNRKSGKQCGNGSIYNPGRLYVPTPEDIAKINREGCVNKLVSLNRKDLAGVTLKNLQKAIQLLEANTQIAERGE